MKKKVIWRWKYHLPLLSSFVIDWTPRLPPPAPSPGDVMAPRLPKKLHDFARMIYAFFMSKIDAWVQLEISGNSGKNP